MIALYNPVVSVTDFFKPDKESYRPKPKDSIPLEGLEIYLSNKYEEAAKVCCNQSDALSIDFGTINYPNSPMIVRSQILENYPPGSYLKISSMGILQDSGSDAEGIPKQPMEWNDIKKFYGAARPNLEDTNQTLIKYCNEHFGLKKGFEKMHTLSTLLTGNNEEKLYSLARNYRSKVPNSDLKSEFEGELESTLGINLQGTMHAPLGFIPGGVLVTFNLNSKKDSVELGGIGFSNTKYSTEDFTDSLKDYIFVGLS